MMHDVDPDVLAKAVMKARLGYQSPWEPGADLEDPNRPWWLHRRVLSDGRVLYLQPMLGSNTRISLSRNEADIGFHSNYCYHDITEAWRAALGWDGEGDPEGWVRHIETGRRRPDGDPEREYINL